MIRCSKFKSFMQYFCPVFDWCLALISSAVSLPLVKPFIGQISWVSFTSSLTPKSKNKKKMISTPKTHSFHRVDGRNIYNILS